ncbi:uncharacterized protein CTRU02_202980 [Colletotrichum truncatum]|uniref:Uncharacterized protein n=1 Tax=Colletotrichum truncatum TaxID=5467 RepID=A0ACC3Z7Z7_COLTU|nr:uncharacterized protein CTRU02_13197 [Colletotrichum truncatum]KAF6783689.1 hypothetical protein CTRU02_13197 [Colletotrichum truncatum]
MICNSSCDFFREELEPNPDVGGVGVLIGFLGTAWLVVILVITRYILAFNPGEDPLHDPKRDRTGHRKHIWHPNPVDMKAVGMLLGLRRWFGDRIDWDQVTTKARAAHLFCLPSWLRTFVLTLCSVVARYCSGFVTSSFSQGSGSC